ncbi:crotonase/enoyl-CoA hydratase family protein [Aquabacter spiritensis]|uniref:Enoyl-CoA hydratase/carnithine racemase n=1 Tax=Aquabacter spiritensis TaxID=933073 RepID=A0A4R3LRH3_9HYPH|nr:crotonase/enoyl-CoA hydratase family protein [Aquabacter spiritensis]TCT02901.1 enoyl-CoA hydratase/carnithine racemase [Aquabacter spiritensis]
MSKPVHCDIADAIATLTLNRPEKLNALNYALLDSLSSFLDALETDGTVRAVIITGSGDRAFSAGADITQFSRSVRLGVPTAVRDFVRRGQAVTSRIEAFCKPVIAAVNGLAYGGGCEIVEACHLSVASEKALFAKPEIKLGMPPTFGGTQRLPRLAGRKRALEMLLTGDAFSAQRALDLGLVNEVVPQGAQFASAQALARRILRHSPLAVTAVLTAVTRGINLSIAEGLAVECEQFARLVPTHDLREGLEAWVEKRRPRYAAS